MQGAGKDVWPGWRWLVLLLVLLQAACASRMPVLPPRSAAPPAAPASSSNDVAMLIAGNDALAARLDLIDGARQRIVFQYYLFHADNSGRLVAEALLRAADRGVEVRGLVDDIGGADNRLLKALNAHPRIGIRRYNPFHFTGGLRLLEMLLNFREVGRRMHNKQLTVDGRQSIVGGRNIGDEYFGSSGAITFADVDVLVAGPAAAELEHSFEDYWTAPRSKARGRDDPGRLEKFRRQLADWAVKEKPALVESVERSAYRQAQRTGRSLTERCPTQVLVDRPGKPDSASPENAVGRQLAQQLRASREDVLLISSYFVPGDTGAALLGRVAQREVSVAVVTNSLASTDVPAVHAGYARYRERLLRDGVQLWETRPARLAADGRLGGSRASLHTKAYFFDRRHLFVGSFNIDPRSAALNTEMGLLFDCPALAAPLRDALAQVLPRLAYRVLLDESGALRWEDGADAVVFDREPEAGPWRNFQVWLLKRLPIESEL
jgi:putative cardiolipin synthase